MSNKKLSNKQKEVMKWLGKGWSAQPSHGSLYTINGGKDSQGLDVRINTLNVLKKLGLVTQDHQLCWKATKLGRQWI